MSGRIRSIKPELLEDEVTAGLTDAAFRLYLGAYLVADDDGNFRADPRKLRSTVFWAHQDVTVEAVEWLLMELWLAGRTDSRSGLFRLYSNGGQRYGHVRNWEKHQRIDRKRKGQIPGPDDKESEEFRPNSQDSTIDRRRLAPDLDLDLDLDQDQYRRFAPTAGSDEPAPSAEPSQSSPTADPPKAEATPMLLHPGKPTLTTPEREVYDHWVTGWRKHVGGIRVPKLDDKRRGKIRARLREGYSVADLKLAIDGMWANPFNLGENPSGKRYTDIELVCRDAIHVDRYLDSALTHGGANAESQPPPPVEYGPPAAPPPELMDRLINLGRESRPPMLREVMDADAERGADVLIPGREPTGTGG